MNVSVIPGKFRICYSALVRRPQSFVPDSSKFFSRDRNTLIRDLGTTLETSKCGTWDGAACG